MAVGVVNSLEVEDAAPASAALAALQQWAERAATREEGRAATRRAHYQERYGRVPRWVEHGMGAQLERVQQTRHRVQMLLGIFAAHGVLALELKPAHTVADLLMQHIEELEAGAKGGAIQMPRNHFRKVFKVPTSRDLLAQIGEEAAA
jgi:hypothetical protein